MNTPRKFKEIGAMLHQGLATIKCPDCDEIFGLNNRKLEQIGEVNVHYFCPYCGKKHGLKKLE